ncbi:folic acid synthesis protein FOL1 [Lingula anatina]|uniref:7,8-dihydroneopterin aldolase n=1 Tax=Lingula anatina TaxID=7574 RepID=A0A1S3IVB7_LINAN|nr:folic acid synthesis protein FOL1 [Lingula anatina]|eukprot:XP_013401489.1 folic acid synthesis protein FOL1 [Lingula anatina]
MATMDNLDLIEIKNLRPRVQIGISPHELGKKQEVVINLTLGVDIRRAAETDDINDTLNYKNVTKMVLEYAESTDINLVEKLAEDIAKICIVCFRAPWVQVAAEKPHALRFTDSVGVKIRRTSKDYPHPIVFVSLGSNINPLQNLKAAVEILKRRTTLLKTSKVFLTPPQLDTNQPPFHNMALKLIPCGDPDTFRGLLKEIEENLLRVRDPLNKNGPRTIDLDIALWGDVIFDNVDVTSLEGKSAHRIPDPDILKFAHTVVPLADVSPDSIHPVVKKTLQEIAVDVTGQRNYLDIFEIVDCTF